MKKKKSSKQARSQNERIFRKYVRDSKKKLDAAKKAEQDSCPHLQGSNVLSEFQGQLTSIVWHEVIPGQKATGICTNCGRKFLSKDKDYKKWMTKKSGNKLSKGGVAVPRTEEENKITSSMDSFSGLDHDSDPKTTLQNWLEQQSPIKEQILKKLDAMTDAEIKNLYQLLFSAVGTGLEGFTTVY